MKVSAENFKLNLNRKKVKTNLNCTRNVYNDDA